MIITDHVDKRLQDIFYNICSPTVCYYNVLIIESFLIILVSTPHYRAIPSHDLMHQPLWCTGQVANNTETVFVALYHPKFSNTKKQKYD